MIIEGLVPISTARKIQYCHGNGGKKFLKNGIKLNKSYNALKNKKS